MSSKRNRKGEVHRVTKETDIRLTIYMDGEGRHEISTGVPFMNHMLTLFSVHGFFDLFVNASGDTDVDDHHTVEDLGICLGQAIKSALEDLRSIRRYGSSSVPMDEALVRVSLDISNRPYLYYGVEVSDMKTGTFDTCLVEEFLRALAQHGGITLHVEQAYGKNAHHIIEAVFKSLARALDTATAIEPRVKKGALSSKGRL